jgi:hypothetical protein
MQIYDLSDSYFTFLIVPSAAVSSSAMVASIVRNLTRNPVLSRERIDNRRRIHYTRLIANVGRRRLMSRINIFQSMSVITNSLSTDWQIMDVLLLHYRPPCSPENSRPPVVNIGSPSVGVSPPRIGDTALALMCLYIALTLFLYCILYYLHVL